MGWKTRGSYDDSLGQREVETTTAEVFEAEFPVVTGRAVKILSEGESPDRIALIDGVETGLELTAIKAADAETIVLEMWRLARQKNASYGRRGIFAGRPIILLGHLDWPSPNVEGEALYDLYEELSERVIPSDFADFGFSEIWLMDDGPKYTSRRDYRAPADFFCFAPTRIIGFWEHERKRRPYWARTVEHLM